MQQRARLIVAGIILATASSAAYVFYVYNPSVSSSFPKCVFYKLTSLHCPGCGVQRAIHSLLHGEIVSALMFNALAVLALPLLCYSLVAWVFEYRRLLPLSVSSKLSYSILFGTLAFWIARNVPLYPFKLLGPNW